MGKQVFHSLGCPRCLEVTLLSFNSAGAQRLPSIVLVREGGLVETREGGVLAINSASARRLPSVVLALEGGFSSVSLV